MSEGNNKVEPMMWLVKTYAHEPSTENYNAVYSAFDRLYRQIDDCEASYNSLSEDYKTIRTNFMACKKNRSAQENKEMK